MNTAPTDDLDTDDRHMTADELEQEERRALREGWEGRGIAARHDRTAALEGARLALSASLASKQPALYCPATALS